MKKANPDSLPRYAEAHEYDKEQLFFSRRNAELHRRKE
jgi:hypothetical protein